MAKSFESSLRFQKDCHGCATSELQSGSVPGSVRLKAGLQTSSDSAKISVIIPTLNEVDALAQTIPTARGGQNVEVIVVDASDGHATRRVAEELGCLAISSPPGRALQLNLGATQASGDIFLFLHADTRLPEGFDEFVRQALQDERVIAGAFRLRIDAAGRALRFIEWIVNLRSRSFGVPYGDQAIFLRRDDFESISGFAELPIMEDFEFMHRLRGRGRIAIAPDSVVTSARRWNKLGPWRTTLLNQFIILAYRFGVSPDRLARWYARREAIGTDSSEVEIE